MQGVELVLGVHGYRHRSRRGRFGSHLHLEDTSESYLAQGSSLLVNVRAPSQLVVDWRPAKFSHGVFSIELSSLEVVWPYCSCGSS